MQQWQFFRPKNQSAGIESITIAAINVQMPGAAF